MRVEAVDSHTTQGAQRSFSDWEVDTEHLLVTWGGECHLGFLFIFVFRLLYYSRFCISFSQPYGVTPPTLENVQECVRTQINECICNLFTIVFIRIYS